MMYQKGTSYKIRLDIAIALSDWNKVIMISPEFNQSIKRSKTIHNNNFTEYTSPGLLKGKFRRGGFGFLDLLFKVSIILRTKPEVVYTTTGHRPAQLIPALIAKKLFDTRLIDERWEYYGVGGRSDERKGLIGKLINKYDKHFELKTVRHFNICITVTERLKEKLGIENTIFFPGVINIRNYPFQTFEACRRTLNIPVKWFIIGALSLGKLDHEDYIPFLKALSELVTIQPNIHIFCTGEDDYINSELLACFPDNIIFKGWLPQMELNTYMSACDIFILPLYPTERNLCRWPIKFNEYLFFKKPVLINPEHEISLLSVKNPLIVKVDNNPEDLKREILSLVKDPKPFSDQITYPDNISFEKKIALLNDLFKAL